MSKEPDVAVDKAEVLEALREQAQRDLRTATAQQRAVHEGATHEESRPENDKDTRALEASYLARGLAQRVLDLTATVAALKALSDAPMPEGAAISAGALVLVEDEEHQRSHYLLAPAGGGAKVMVGGVEVRVVTPHAPLGEALLGKRAGDDVELRAAHGLKELFIVSVR